MARVCGVQSNALGNRLVVRERSTGDKVGETALPAEPWSVSIDVTVFPMIKSAADVLVQVYTRGTRNRSGGWGYEGTIEFIPAPRAMAQPDRDLVEAVLLPAFNDVRTAITSLEREYVSVASMPPCPDRCLTRYEENKSLKRRLVEATAPPPPAKRARLEQDTPPPLNYCFIVAAPGSVKIYEWTVEGTHAVQAHALWIHAQFVWDGSVQASVVRWFANELVDLPFSDDELRRLVRLIPVRTQDSIGPFECVKDSTTDPGGELLTDKSTLVYFINTC